MLHAKRGRCIGQLFTTKWLLSGILGVVLKHLLLTLDEAHPTITIDHLKPIAQVS